MEPVLIMVAPTGARRSKADHPGLPISPEEVAETAQACLAAGAGAIHAHVRDSEGNHSLNAEAYRIMIAAIRARCGDNIAIQVTTESAGRFGVPAQIDVIRTLRPRAISLAPREIFRDGQDTGFKALDLAAETNIAVQYILYDNEDIDHFAHLRTSGRIPDASPPRIILVLGRYGSGTDSTVGDFEARHARLVQSGLAGDTVWSVCAFGSGEIACLEAAMQAGGHVRVGFENAIVDADGRLAKDNASRVALVAAAARRLGREPASGSDARKILGTA